MTHLTNSDSAPRRRQLLSLYLLFSFLFAGCQPAPVTASSPGATSYTLMVINGTGGGRYPAGSTVHVWANPYLQGWTFDRWTGNTQPVPDIRAMHATLVMPAQDVRIEATYEPIPTWDASYASMLNRDVYYYFPASPYKGVILFFHGSGGEAREWSDLGAERKHFFDDAIAHGYAVLSLNSLDRVTKQWDLAVPPASNPDLEAVEAILTAFRAEGKISDGTPIYAVGMSRGGRFASLVSYTLQMKATAIWVGLGHADVMPVTTVPTAWCLADHDPIIDRQEAFAQYQQLMKRSVDTALYVHPQTPLYPLYFVNIAGVDRTGSAQLFADLESQGYLDEDYFLNENPRISRWEKHIGLEYSEAVRLDIQDRLFVAYAEHAFYSECDHRVLDFFAAHP